MSDSPKPLSDTLEHPLEPRLLGAATSTAALIDRAQLAERQGRTQEARALYEQALSQFQRHDFDQPFEVHLLWFPNHGAFAGYLADTRRTDLLARFGEVFTVKHVVELESISDFTE